ncbi:unnamed protein product [Symbiodinium natans]|uniref:Uncharacterized protein n=1 Tax=Symbiodinium natans TaxID=878477 RepID=A0A812M3H4_9DINO|nr:unnamed protein product [Symbiodinium natans]
MAGKAGKESCGRRAFKICFALFVALATSSIVFAINMSTGAFAVGSIGVQLQDSIGNRIETYMVGKMEPLRIYLQQGINMFDEYGWNLSQWEDLQKTLPYQRSFLETYFDESRCCSGIWTNLRYDDAVRCHPIENPDCLGTKTNSMEGEIGRQDLGGDAIWAGTVQYSDTYTTGSYPGLEVCDGTCENEHSGDFVQVLPAKISGARNNTLVFRWYEKQRSLSPWLGEDTITSCPEASGPECKQKDSFGHWVQPIGFVHWPIQDGYWYRDIQYYNLTKGQVRFATRVFPWTLYPPAVMKSHMFTPIYNPQGERIGGWVVGFKLHWITAYLRDLKKPPGTFIFIVERNTGVLISTSDPHIPVLKDYTTSASYQDVILATECPDLRVSERAKKLLEMAGASNPQDWSRVRNVLGRPEIKTTGVEPVEEFLLSRDFEHQGLDWVVAITIPGDTILEDINANMLIRLGSILAATGGMKIFSSVVLTGVLMLWVKHGGGDAGDMDVDANDVTDGFDAIRV